jgi:hypothetical protein
VRHNPLRSNSFKPSCQLGAGAAQCNKSIYTTHFPILTDTLRKAIRRVHGVQHLMLGRYMREGAPQHGSHERSQWESRSQSQA